MPRSLLRLLPEGTLKAAQQAEKAASEKDKERDPAAADRLAVFLRAQLLPTKEGAARPWVWAGPVRAWSVDYETARDPGLWVCCSSTAFLLRASRANLGTDSLARSWHTGDGLMVRLAAEMIAGCRAHKEPKNAVKLFNNITWSAWSRLPADVERKYSVRREVMYEKAVTSFVMDALDECGHAPFAARLRDARKKHLEEARAKRERQAAAAAGGAAGGTAGSKRPAGAGTARVPVPDERRPAKAARLSSSAASASASAVAAASTAITAAPAEAEAEAASASSSRAAPGAAFAASTAAAAAAAAAAATSAKPQVKPPPKSIKAAPPKPKPAAAPKGPPDDAGVARAMLSVLKASSAPLSLAQVAMTCKSKVSDVPWNFGKWMGAVQRGIAARPGWFTQHGSDMIGVGPEAGIEPPEPLADGSVARGGPGDSVGGAGSTLGAKHGEEAEKKEGPVKMGGPGAVRTGGPGAFSYTI